MIIKSRIAHLKHRLPIEFKVTEQSLRDRIEAQMDKQ
jgi:hypothetical protein